MATQKLKKPVNVVEKNIRLSGQVMNYLLANPQMLQGLPDSFDLVILPEDDPDVRLYNMDLLDRLGSVGKPIVFARVKSHADVTASPPSLFVPLAIAA